jgi:hypothetical protein
MEKFARAFLSIRMMATAMIIFLLAIGTATILESMYDIQTAKIIIYNAGWFEVLLAYLAINLIANIFRYKMFQRAKIAMLTFHLSFIVILIGAGITRSFGIEGIMMIREGESSNKIYSADPHLWVKINDGKIQTEPFSLKKFMTETKPFGLNVNYFSIPVKFPNHPKGITIEYVDFQKKMVDSLVINDSIDGIALEIITDGMKSNYLGKGEFIFAGQTAISFEKKDAMPGVQLFQQGNKIVIRSKNAMSYLPMAQMQKARQSGMDVSDSLFVKVPADSLVQFQTTTLYNIDGQQIVFKQIIQHAKMMLISSGRRDVGADYLTVKVTEGSDSKIVQLKGGMGAIPNHVIFEFNGLTYEMEYGSVLIDLPFSIAIRDQNLHPLLRVK